MKRGEMYYRFQADDLPPFSAKNAFSRPWGAYGRKCMTCEGLGQCDCPHCEGLGQCDCPHCEGDCLRCKGSGLLPCADCEGRGMDQGRESGYSCCETLEDLEAYFCEHALSDLVELPGKVIEFSGQLVGHGPDGEFLVVPDMKNVKNLKL